MIFVLEIGRGISDENVLDLANKDERIIITNDDDFGELVVRQQRKVRGLILLQLDRLSGKARDDRAVECICANMDRFEGNLIVIRPDDIRARPLPDVTSSND